MGYSDQTVQKRRFVAKKWIKEMGYSVEELANFNSNQLRRATPYVHSKKDADKILEKAQELNFDDFLKWLKDAFSK